jgi:hypothetical protein
MAESVYRRRLGADGMAFDHGERSAERASGCGGYVLGDLGAAEFSCCGFEAARVDAIFRVIAEQRSVDSYPFARKKANGWGTEHSGDDWVES